MGLPPRGGQYFLSKRKKVPKKASGTATPGKSPLLPIFERGSSQCRAQHSWIVITYNRARSCSLFSSFKKGKAFSLRCLSPLCSPAVDARHTQIAVLGMFQCSLDDGAAQKNRIVFFCGWRYPYTNNTAWDASMQLGYICNTKCQRGFKSTLAFLCEP